MGAWFTGRNEVPGRTWETRSKVVAADRGREFAWVVGGALGIALPEITGPGETWPTRTPLFISWRRIVWTKQVIAHFDPE